MKAIVCRRYGAPDVLKVEEVERVGERGYHSLRHAADHRSWRPVSSGSTAAKMQPNSRRLDVTRWTG